MRRPGGFDETVAVPPGRAARPEAASSFGPIAIHYWASLRPRLGTAIAPRRRAPFRQTLLAPLLGVTLLLAGCGGGGTVSPTAETVIGTVPTSTKAAVPAGDASAGAKLFKDNGCGGCHKFAPAGTNKTTGPDLDKLADFAKKANQGSEKQFAFDSIKNPGGYVESGYENIMPNLGLSDEQVADLVAYLTKG
jgi:cytochrome c551/c552